MLWVLKWFCVTLRSTFSLESFGLKAHKQKSRSEWRRSGKHVAVCAEESLRSRWGVCVLRFWRRVRPRPSSAGHDFQMVQSFSFPVPQTRGILQRWVPERIKTLRLKRVPNIILLVNCKHSSPHEFNESFQNIFSLFWVIGSGSRNKTKEIKKKVDFD